MVLSYAATMDSGESKKQILIADVERAYFDAMARRDLYIDLPREDVLGGPEMWPKRRFNLYGPRDGASNWQEHLANHMVKIGFWRGIGHPSIFWNDAPEDNVSSPWRRLLQYRCGLRIGLGRGGA